MKRDKRQKLGNCTNKQRRRLMKILRNLRRGYGRGRYATTPCQKRDARRLQEAGLVIAVVSKSLPWNRTKEITLFLTREEALQQYPRYCIMR